MTDGELNEIRQYCSDFNCPIKAEEDSVTQRFCDRVCDEFQGNCPFMNVGLKLKDYEDAEEQGLLLRLPCKVDDMVWITDFGKLCAYRITGYSFGVAEDYINEPVSETELVFYYENLSMAGSFAMSAIGKSVFLTKEEAEQALKQMGE